MGRRGPAPWPSAKHKLTGGWRGNPKYKGSNACNEPQPEKGRPICPAWLSPEAKRVWKRLLPILEQMRVCTKADIDLLTCYCEKFAHWRECVTFLRKHGDTYPIYHYLKDGTRGEAKGFTNFPQVKTALAEAEALIRMGDRLGLSPSARTRISVEPEVKVASGVAKFLGNTAG